MPKSDPELLAYIRTHLKAHGVEELRKQLLADGVEASKVDAALAEAAAAPKIPALLRRRLAFFALAAGVLLLALAGYLSMQKGPGSDRSPSPDPDRENPAQALPEGEQDNVYRGHYGFMIKLPAGYGASAGFSDPRKTLEIVHLFPIGTDSTHFIHEGLYGQLGIVRIEVYPRSRPEGSIGLPGLKALALSRLRTERAIYTSRPLMINGMQGIQISATEPFTYAKAYLVGQKVVYTITGGSENELFNNLLSSLLEVSPHDDPGK
jgi:hypothetical protein